MHNRDLVMPKSPQGSMYAAASNSERSTSRQETASERTSLLAGSSPHQSRGNSRAASVESQGSDVGRDAFEPTAQVGKRSLTLAVAASRMASVFAAVGGFQSVDRLGPFDADKTGSVSAPLLFAAALVCKVGEQVFVRRATRPSPAAVASGDSNVDAYARMQALTLGFAATYAASRIGTNFACSYRYAGTNVSAVYPELALVWGYVAIALQGMGDQHGVKMLRDAIGADKRALETTTEV